MGAFWIQLCSRIRLMAFLTARGQDGSGRGQSTRPPAHPPRDSHGERRGWKGCSLSQIGRVPQTPCRALGQAHGRSAFPRATCQRLAWSCGHWPADLSPAGQPEPEQAQKPRGCRAEQGLVRAARVLSDLRLDGSVITPWQGGRWHWGLPQQSPEGGGLRASGSGTVKCGWLLGGA